MTNCVLGFSTYDWNGCGVFVRSLRESGYVDDLVLIGNGPGQEYEDRYGITVKSMERPKDIVMSRFDYYFGLLNENQWDKVMLSDVRDIVFQADPFSLIGNRLHLASEDLRVGEQRHNRDRCKEGFGNDGFEFLKDKQIICAGTILGSKDCIMGYIDEFDTLVSANLDRNKKNLPPITDQAALIWLFHTGKLNHLSAVLDSNDGHHTIWTIGTRDETHIGTEFYAFDGYTVKMLDGHVPPVIHQYDRHPPIVRALENHYLS